MAVTVEFTRERLETQSRQSFVRRQCVLTTILPRCVPAEERLRFVEV